MQSYGKMDSSANNSSVLLYDNMVNNVRSRLYLSLTIVYPPPSPKKTLNVTYSIFIAYLCLLLAFLYEIGK